MEREVLVRALRRLREEIRQLNDDPWSPAVERSVSLADMYLHMALWHLGEEGEMTPELHTAGREC